MSTSAPTSVLPVARSTVATTWCRTCDKRRALSVAGTCLVCAQRPAAEPGDPCALCFGEGVIDGVDDAPPACPACTGTGQVPEAVRR